MAGFSDDETRALLHSQLTDPSITPPDAPRATGGAPASLRDSLMDRIYGSAGRLAMNPGVQGAMMGSPGAGLLKSGIDAGVSALAGDQGRSPVSFERNSDADNPPQTTLTPSVTPDVNVTPAPTLTPGYGQTMRPSALAGPGGFGGLKGALDTARNNQFGSMDEAQVLQTKQGDLQAARVDAKAALDEQEAQRQQDAAASQKRIDDDTAQRQQTFLDSQQQKLDELGQMKVDPKRIFKNQDAGTQFSMWVGGVLGGMLAGANGGSNTSLDRLDKIIDRDINAQINEQDNKKAEVTGRAGLYNQMLAQSGDARVAAAATRNMMLEAAKLSLNAKAAQLGIPEITTQAQIAANELDQKQKILKTSIAEANLKNAQAAAAAAESARRAEAQRQFENSLKVAQLGLDQDKNKIALIAAGKDAHKEDDQAIQAAAKQLGDDDIVNNAGLVRSLASRVKGNGDDETLQGFDAGARGRMGAANALTLGLAPGIAAKAALSKDELKAQQEWNQAALTFKNLKTGSGASEKEAEAIQAAFQGRGTAAERINAVRMLEDILNRREQSARGGLNDDQAKELKRRMAREGKTDLPSSVRTK